jgi:ParB family chromosome partitioning protein
MENHTNPRKKGLGRGLGALIVDTQTRAPTTHEAAISAEANGIRLLPLDSITPNPHQPRTSFDENSLRELAASIQEHGIIQPLIVTAAPHQPGAYWLVAGERRWRAARLAKLDAAPAIVRDASSQQLVEWALVENVQRDDLNPLEEASAYQTLLNEFGLSQAEVAQRVGKSRSAVANTVRLLQLPSSIQEALMENRISAGHARALLAMSNSKAMMEAMEAIIARGLNVRQTEALIKRMSASTDEIQVETSETVQLRTHIRHIENRFRAALGTRVNLNRNPDGSGRLIVHFYSDEELDNLIHLIANDDKTTTT